MGMAQCFGGARAEIPEIADGGRHDMKSRRQILIHVN